MKKDARQIQQEMIDRKRANIEMYEAEIRKMQIEISQRQAWIAKYEERMKNEAQLLANIEAVRVEGVN